MSVTIRNKKSIVCDLDGTLALSKARMGKEMADWIRELVSHFKFGVLGGGNPKLFFSQIVEPLEARATGLLSRLALLPTSGARGYVYIGNKWEEAYAETLSLQEIKQIREAFRKAFTYTHYPHPQKVHGEVIEDRGTAVVFSAMGQEAPLLLREGWNKESDCRIRLQAALAPLLPHHEIRIGGLAS